MGFCERKVVQLVIYFESEGAIDIGGFHLQKKIIDKREH